MDPTLTPALFGAAGARAAAVNGCAARVALAAGAGRVRSRVPRLKHPTVPGAGET